MFRGVHTPSETERRITWRVVILSGFGFALLLGFLVLGLNAYDKRLGRRVHASDIPMSARDLSSPPYAHTFSLLIDGPSTATTMRTRQASQRRTRYERDEIPPVVKGCTTVVGSERTLDIRSEIGTPPPPPHVVQTSMQDVLPDELPPAPGAVRKVIAAQVMHPPFKLPKPRYPPLARQARVQGKVSVEILIDETGKVVFAKVASGNPLLAVESRRAAMETRFSPTTIDNKPVKVSGVIVYNFVMQ
jgi:TonB family protein